MKRTFRKIRVVFMRRFVSLSNGYTVLPSNI